MKRVFLLLTIILKSCEPSKEKIELIITNANFYNVDGDLSKAQSFAFKQSKFIIGTNEEIAKKI